MAFNGAGVFSILNSFSPNTTILSAAVNANFTDIATGLSDCLTRDNQLGMAAPLRHTSGTSAAPSATFTSNTTTGAYLRGTSNLGLVANAVGISLNQQGMRVATAVVSAGGANYAVGDTITLTGGTAIYQIILTVATLSGSAVATVSITDQGLFDVIGSNPMAQGSTSGSGTGATFTITWTATTLISDLTGSGTLWGALGMSSYISGLVRSLTAQALSYLIVGGSGTNPWQSFGAAINLQLNATVATSLLTVSVKNNVGNNASPTAPIMIPFRDSTIANGGPVWRSVTAALSIDTNAIGANLGSSSSTAFRFWVVAFDNGGTVVLGLINCSTAGAIYPLNEGAVQSSTAMSAAANSAGVFYTQNGTTVTNKAFRILGYIDYASGLATAGTYSAGPTTIQLFGPGTKKPGDTLQTAYASSGSVATTSFTYTVSNTAPAAGSVASVSVAMTPSAAMNHIQLSSGIVTSHSSGGNADITSYIATGTTAATTLISTSLFLANGNNISQQSLFYETVPNATSSTTYTLYACSSGGNTTINGIGGAAELGSTGSTFIRAVELSA